MDSPCAVVEVGERKFRLDFATGDDDAALRSLLRSTPMPGSIQISLEREPGYFAAAEREGGRHYTICARDLSSGCLVAMGSRVVHEVFVNGEPRRLGFLGQLRIATTHRRFARILLQKGFDFLQRTRAIDEAPFDITTIVAGNAIARHTLEKGLPGFPVFTAVERVLTMLLPVRAYPSEGKAGEDPGAARRDVQPPQFAVVPPHPEARLHTVAGGTVARWDQRAFKQIVICGYSPLLHRLRWFFRLPQTGAPAPIAHLTHFRVENDDPRACTDLLDEALTAARRETDCRWLTLGLAARHPLVPVVQRRYRPRVYESILYLVHPRNTVVALDGRLIQVEVALL